MDSEEHNHHLMGSESQVPIAPQVPPPHAPPEIPIQTPPSLSHYDVYEQWAHQMPPTASGVSTDPRDFPLGPTESVQHKDYDSEEDEEFMRESPSMVKGDTLGESAYAYSSRVPVNEQNIDDELMFAKDMSKGNENNRVMDLNEQFEYMHGDDYDQSKYEYDAGHAINDQFMSNVGSDNASDMYQLNREDPFKTPEHTKTDPNDSSPYEHYDALQYGSSPQSETSRMNTTDLLKFETSNLSLMNESPVPIHISDHSQSDDSDINDDVDDDMRAPVAAPFELHSQPLPTATSTGTVASHQSVDPLDTRTALGYATSEISEPNLVSQSFAAADASRTDSSRTTEVCEPIFVESKAKDNEKPKEEANTPVEEFEDVSHKHYSKDEQKVLKEDTKELLQEEVPEEEFEEFEKPKEQEKVVEEKTFVKEEVKPKVEPKIVDKENIEVKETIVEPTKMAPKPSEPTSTTSCEGCPFASGAWFNPNQMHPCVAELVYWRDPKKSGIVFGIGFIILLSLTYFSIISVAAYTSLAALSVTLSFRIYKNILQAIQKTNEGHPFKDYLEIPITPSPERIHQIVDVLLKHLNSTLIKLRSVFLVEDIIDSLKFVVIFWCLTYIGSWFNGLTLVILLYLAFFSLPKVYEMNKTQIDQYMHVAYTNVHDVVSKIRAKIPFPVKKEKDQ